MSLIFMDGFEAEQNPAIRGWTITSNQSGVVVDTSIKRSGEASCKIQSRSYTGSSWYGKLSYLTDVSSDTMIIGFGLRFSAFNPAVEWLSIGNNDGSRLVKFFIDSTGSIYATNSGSLGDGSRQLTLPYTIQTNTWYYFQIKVKSDPINGQITILLGNEIVSNITGINTSSNSSKIDSIYFYQGSTATYAIWVDDIYVVNTVPPTDDFIGICSIAGSRPISNGDVMHFESVGNAEQWQTVDDTVTDTSDYIYGDGLNEKSLFIMSDVTTVGDIKGITVFDYAARSEEGQGISKYKMVLRNESDQEYESNEVNLPGANWSTHTQVFEKNPITDTTQDMTSVNELQLGVVITQVD